MATFNVYNDVFMTKQVSSFFPPWANYRRVTAIIKMIKAQSELNPNYFPMGSLGEEIH